MALVEDVREITEEGYLHPWLWALSTGILAGWEALYQREQDDLADAIESLHDVDAEKDSANEVVLSESEQVQVEDLVSKVLMFCEELAGVPLFPYQRELAHRMIESLIINDGEEITALWSRQSGKTQSVSLTIAGCMVILPKLASVYPELLGKYERGLMVGVFAPVEDQAETLYGRVVDWLTSDRALAIMLDPEIDDRPQAKGKLIKLRRNGSFCRMQTANPRAKIESKSYHLMVIDECFPAETPVLTSEGWVPIGTIVNGGRRDWVVATQDVDGRIGWADVKTAYKTPRFTPLVRVDHEHGSVYATANHPFMVDGRHVPAIDLTPGTVVSVVPGAPQPSWEEVQEPGHVVLLSQVPGGAAGSLGGYLGGVEPEQGPRGTGEDQSHAQTHWAPPQGAGREWSRADRAAAEALGRSWARVGGRACLPYWSAGERRSTVPLQVGPRLSSADDLCGDRRGLPWDVAEAGSGPAQGAVAVESRVVGVEVLQPGDPQFDQFRDGADYVYTLEVGSESHTYIAGGVLVANCQEADDYTISKSIHPMGAFYNATIVKTGTPARVKGNFYRAIQHNKRRQSRRGIRQNHFQFDWRYCAKYNPNYRKFVEKEKVRIGEDSDEFQLSYELKWLLDRGMFITESRFLDLSDKSMETVKSWWHSPVLVGIDPAKTIDSTVVTVVHVDWEHPDEFGFYHHRVLNWLELFGEDWEEQYFQIVDFLAAYDVFAIGVDGTGVGDVVADRLARLMPRAEVHALGSTAPHQSARWKHLNALIDRGMVSWPGNSRARRLKTWQRFSQQMTDALKKYQGPNMLVEAPTEADAHDDYCDSLALACALTIEVTMPEIQVDANPFYTR